MPFTVKAATELVKSRDSNDLSTSQIPGYSHVELLKTYGAVEQRWLLVVKSKKTRIRFKKIRKKNQKRLGSLSKKTPRINLSTICLHP